MSGKLTNNPAVWVLLWGGAVASAPLPTGIAEIPAGRFAPLFGLDQGQKDFPVKKFWMDRIPVTQGDFQGFILKNPGWRKGRVSELYAETGYLKNWKKNGTQPSRLEAPVVYVSWFAASAYCEWRGGRLPSVLEWEYAAAASETRPNALKDPEFSKRILEWYSKPSSEDEIRPVGAGRANFYGVMDLHGLVWEWTGDFNSVFVTGDNRQDGELSNSLYCGSGAIGAGDRSNYAAFMRYAMRSSLEASFTLGNLGFRCVYDRAPARPDRKGDS